MRYYAMKRSAAIAAALMMLATSGCADTGKDKSSKTTSTAVVTSADANISADDIEVGYEEN
ncbi:MAG: hypothetical protein J6Z29_11605, partial [Ruminococcus sp.]|nr:hypothetical protein [Ruminococcus sp.]